jgi:hypothetical protein
VRSEEEDELVIPLCSQPAVASTSTSTLPSPERARAFFLPLPGRPRSGRRPVARLMTAR